MDCFALSAGIISAFLVDFDDESCLICTHEDGEVIHVLSKGSILTNIMPGMGNAAFSEESIDGFKLVDGPDGLHALVFEYHQMGNVQHRIQVGLTEKVDAANKWITFANKRYSINPAP